MLQQLAMKGYHGAAGDILDRVKYDGDPLMTRQLENYLSGDRSSINRTITMRDAMNGKRVVNMSEAAGREGTVFDPGAENAAENYVMRLPDGTEVPVLGHNAYGGKVNRYGAGQFSASEHENALFDLMRTYDKGMPTKQAAG